jgi:hypothetical protein
MHISGASGLAAHTAPAPHGQLDAQNEPPPAVAH